MKMKIISIHGHGKANEEHVELTVLEDCNLNHYIIADTTYTDDGYISNKARHAHWFIGKEVKKGDSVILYTGVGKNRTSQSQSGKSIFHRYWGLKIGVWNDDGDGAVLIEISNWNTTKVSATK